MLKKRFVVLFAVLIASIALLLMVPKAKYPEPPQPVYDPPWVAYMKEHFRPAMGASLEERSKLFDKINQDYDRAKNLAMRPTER